MITIFIATAAAHPAAAAHRYAAPSAQYQDCIVGLLLIAATLAARWHDAGLEER